MKLNDFFNKLTRKAYPESEVNLLSFSPQKTLKSNRYILDQIKVATSIKNRHDNNIALDGDYGVGKSSILYSLKTDLRWRIINRPKTISFLSFSTTETENENSQKEKLNSNFLQSEIIRQLYYGEHANRLKGSGYKRTGKHYFLSSLLISIILGTLILFQIYHIDMLTFLDVVILCFKKGFNLDTPSTYSLLWVTIVVILTLLIDNVLKLMSNGSIKNISAKDLSIELSDQEPDFNQLIDLLIYYFRKTKRRVIIFEDLDRLQNPRIFEELRQLNFTLNNRNNFFGTIKFIYAARSSLFSAKVANGMGVEKINTKMFDLIIPVVPFLTKVNFSNILQGECEKIGLAQKINGIENILSRHTADMRVVRAFLNNMLVYKNIFELQTHIDYKNVAALSILRVFAPNDYMKLSTGNSLLDLAREQCSFRKEVSIKQAREKRTIEYRIKHKSKSIWSAIIEESQSSQNTDPKFVIVNNEKIMKNDDFLIRIYEAEQDSNIQVCWSDYDYINYNARELHDIIDLHTKEDLSSISIEKEIKELAEKDCFTFYNSSITLTNKKEEDPLGITQKIVRELLENNFVTEDYARFITQAVDMDVDVDRALRYIFGYIRNNKRSDEYVLSPAAAAEVINRIDNTDLMSAGMYNFDLFDLLIKNAAQYSDKLNRILSNAKADLDSFMVFFDSYCCKYKNILEAEGCTGLSESSIANLSKTIPPAFLTMRLAKIYPKELMTKVAQSSLKDTNAKEVIYNIAVISLDNPQGLELEKQNRSLLKYYADTIIKNENGKENLFKLFIANSIPISNLDYFNASNDTVKNYLDKILITVNENNLSVLDDDILIKYITRHQLDIDDFVVVMKSDKDNVKQYIVKNIEKIMVNNKPSLDCLQQAATYSCRKKIPLVVDEILQYADKINTKILIGMILSSDLTKEEIVIIMSKCNDGNLSKIQTKRSFIRLTANKNNEMFAKKLETLRLATKQKGRKDKSTIWLQVL